MAREDVDFVGTARVVEEGTTDGGAVGEGTVVWLVATMVVAIGVVVLVGAAVVLGAAVVITVLGISVVADGVTVVDDEGTPLRTMVSPAVPSATVDGFEVPPQAANARLPAIETTSTVRSRSRDAGAVRKRTSVGGR